MMFKQFISYLIILFFPLNTYSINIRSTCDSLKFPRECHCQSNRYIQINETRLRCRQLTEISSNYHWSNISYDRLIFETLNENLTVNSYVFSNTFIRTLRFHIHHLFFDNQIFNNVFIEQLSLLNYDTYGKIYFLTNKLPIFSNTILINFDFKSMDFQTSISESIFFNTKIDLFLIESSKFYGFTNEQHKNLPKLNSIRIYRILSSINTEILTENYFPNNFDYNQFEEIDLSFNHIKILNDQVFSNLKNFSGNLILKNNHIEHINLHTFKNLYLLKNLSLTKNFLKNLSSNYFSDLKQLFQLDLCYNRINQLDSNLFKYLENLQILHLNNNPLEFIHPNAFENLFKLKEIHLKENQFIHLSDQIYFQWIWNLANLHVIHLLKNDFELSDVAFCILSRSNKTLYHYSHQYSCSCNIHYFNLNQNLTDNHTLISSKHQTNYLRLTPICHENSNNNNSIFHEQINENDLIIKDFENTCDYKLIFLDCDAMTTTTTTSTTITVQTTILLETETETETMFELDNSTELTTEMYIPTTKKPGGIRQNTTLKTSLSNMKKLFTVLATLIAITIAAIFLIIFWYRFKIILKRRKKEKNLVEQQQHFNTPVSKNHHVTVPHYTSSDVSGSLYSGYLSTSQSQSEALIESPTSITSKPAETVAKSPLEGLLEKNPQDMQAVTLC